jgi:beta-glucanase (GH16 family)
VRNGGVDAFTARPRHTAKLQVPSFSTVDTNVWSINNGGGWLSQTFSTSQTSTSSNQLKLAISPCTGSCTGFNFSAGGITTTSSLYGYGIYTAEIKAPVSPGFTAQLEVPSPHLFRFLSFSLSLSLSDAQLGSL